MKTTLKQFATATLIALMISVINVNAKETSKKDSQGDSATIIVTTEVQLTVGTNRNSGLANNDVISQETEENLALESWMVTTEDENSDFYFGKEIENPLNVEKWMMPRHKKHSKRFIIEAPLSIEYWMTDFSSVEQYI